MSVVSDSQEVTHKRTHQSAFEINLNWHATPSASLSTWLNAETTNFGSKQSDSVEGSDTHRIADLPQGMCIKGVHMFAVEREAGHERDSVFPDEFVITITDGVNDSQFGPQLTLEDKANITKALHADRVIPVGPQMIWYALELMRLLPGIGQYSRVYESGRMPPFCVERFYQDNTVNRRRSMALARHCVLQTTPVIRCDIVANEYFVTQFAQNLPLLRLKWKEIQEKKEDVRDYKLTSVTTTEKDTKLLGTNAMRLDLLQSATSGWTSHIMYGTKVYLVLENDEHIEVTVVSIGENRHVKLCVEDVQVSDIKSIYILRGDETLTEIKALLEWGKRFLVCNQPRPGGIQFVARSLGLPTLSPAEIKDMDDDNTTYLLAPIVEPIVRVESRSRRRRRDIAVHTYGKKVAATRKTLTDTLPIMLDNLNDQQRAMAQSEHRSIVCEGYPGSGKTQTLAVYVLARFQALLRLRHGWILCLTNANAAAIQIVKTLKRCPSFDKYSEFLVHGYSDLYRAFHENDFKVSYDHRITPKKELSAHGILVSTIGHLPSVLTKYTFLTSTILDLVTDESGQTWLWTSMLFLSPLSNVQRWGIFGDSSQLPPYVHSLAQLDAEFPSVMTPFTSDARGTTPENKVRTICLLRQYRMVRELCDIHARIFYAGRGIITVRQTPAECKYPGTYWERIPPREERPPGKVHVIVHYNVTTHMIR